MLKMVFNIGGWKGRSRPSSQEVKPALTAPCLKEGSPAPGGRGYAWNIPGTKANIEASEGGQGAVLDPTSLFGTLSAQYQTGASFHHPAVTTTARYPQDVAQTLPPSHNGLDTLDLDLDLDNSG